VIKVKRAQARMGPPPTDMVVAGTWLTDIL